MGIVGNIRGFAQGIIRQAVGLGRTVEQTFTTLVETGLDYARHQFLPDWQAYNAQQVVLPEIAKLPKDQLISGGMHVDSPQTLQFNFKYDVKRVFEDVKGKVTTFTWSVVSNQRLTQTEIESEAGIFSVEYAPEEPGFYGDTELVGAWAKAA